MLLKYLGEEGAAASFDAAVSVSAPIDLALATQRISTPRNWVYHRWLVANTKRDWLNGPATLDSRQVEAVRRSRTLYGLDDEVVGPLNGFAGADDYYQRCSSQQFLAAIRVPTLVIHASDDPWIPVAMYRHVDWVANCNLSPVITPGCTLVVSSSRSMCLIERIRSNVSTMPPGTGTAPPTRPVPWT